MNTQPKGIAITQGINNLLGTVADINDDFMNTCFVKTRQMMHDERLTRDG